MKPIKDITEGYWVCACVRRNPDHTIKALKMNPPSRTFCRVCGLGPLADRSNRKYSPSSGADEGRGT